MMMPSNDTNNNNSDSNSTSFTSTSIMSCDDMKIKFGPNKTARQRNLKCLLTCLLIILLAILCAFLLLNYNPSVRKSVEKVVQLMPFLSSSQAPLRTLSPSNDTGTSPAQQSTGQEPATKQQPHKQEAGSKQQSARRLSDRNDMDPVPVPMDLLPSNSLPGSSAAGDPMTEGESVDADDGEENPNLVQGDVLNVTWVKAKYHDHFKGKPVVVQTKLGKVRGTQGQVFGHKLNVFLGIPFTEDALIGDRRFQPSAPKTTAWKGVLNATQHKPHCPQAIEEHVVDKRTVISHQIAEDCLYLNVWAPVAAGQSNSDTRLKPVMVWVFGGGFAGGSNNLDEMDGRMLAALGDVIVVTINYRVGAFGFLDMGIPGSAGNMGLYDVTSGDDFTLFSFPEESLIFRWSLFCCCLLAGFF